MNLILGFVIILLLLSPAHTMRGLAEERETIDGCERMMDYADRKLIRPSPKERVALIKLLEQKPRPKTLIDADVKYLRALLDKAVWTGAERRILREIWQEVTGQTLDLQRPESSEGK